MALQSVFPMIAHISHDAVQPVGLNTVTAGVVTSGRVEVCP